MAKNNQTFNSLDALVNWGKPQEEVTQPKKTLPKNEAMNFAVFLHKRKRFFEHKVYTMNKYGTEVVHHKQYTVKKINIDEVCTNGEKTEHSDITDFNKFPPKKFFERFIARHRNNATTLCDTIVADDTLKFKPDWRLAIGLGSGSVFETSMSLHHIYGFPYIPASAVKGALRSYLITGIFEKTASEGEQAFSLLNAEYRAYQDIDFCKIFGCPAKYSKIEFDENNQPKKNEKGDYIKKQKDVALKNSKGEGQEHIGSIIFFDAYPTECPTGKIKADIMNPHYPDYYNGKLPPADWQNPVPIIFLTVENLPFQFMIGLCKGVDNFDVEIGEYKGKVIEQVTLMLKHALQNHGIGAKTAVGYGYMQ